ncbi:MAG TPA: DUF6580 family putative transport protein [Candidatus Saccharimonadales bacterium]|jgi:hypothetical protein|nr:DUF6580 family putative transport protein [Candidatus Saccharimonadales bacterium]
MKEKYFPTIIALSLIVIGVTLRILPHPANFAPIAAIAIFGGAVLPKKIAIWVPLGAMMISDAVIGFYSLMPLIWGCYLLIALASSHWLRPAKLLKGALLTVSSSVFFFAATNFGVWLTSGMYVHNWSGIVSCYTLALPFFRNTALSDAVYTAALFGIYALATYRQKASAKVVS